MVQGKFKKSKLPDGIKSKKQKSRGSAFTRRQNAPIQAKKTKFTEHQKIKQAITKTLNRSVEDGIRSMATEGELKLSKAQEVVAKANSKPTSITASKSSNN